MNFTKHSRPLKILALLNPLLLFITVDPTLVLGKRFYLLGKKSLSNSSLYFSQGHKHIQVLPLNRDYEFQPPLKQLFDEIYDRQIGQIYAINKLPFVHVIIGLDNNILRAAKDQETLTSYLAQMFFGILDAMFQQLRENSLPLDTSYNFLMTQDFMMLVPRSKESATIEHDGKTYEFSINSMGFAGSILCKSDEELKALEAQDNLMDMLTQVGVAWNPDAEKYNAARQRAETTELL